MRLTRTRDEAEAREPTHLNGEAEGVEQRAKTPDGC